MIGRKVGRILWLIGIVTALGFIAVVPGSSAIVRDEPQAVDDEGPALVDDGPAGDDVGPVTGTEGPTTVGDRQRQSGSALQCTRSRNGGSTDTGVEQSRIKLASTVVKSGAGASFLGLSPDGMKAIVSSVNRAGGVCGRFLNPLTLVDDAWDAQRGLGFLKNFIAEEYFALPVVPSSEGLTAAIESGDIARAGIPVVGTDGMLKQQYENPWVWPVATATVSTMRIMARYGHEKGARNFGIVYDTRYRFGKEGAAAFRDFVKGHLKANLLADVGIFPGRASYSSEIQKFNSACGGKCEFVAMLLEPQTALTWIAGRPQFGTKVTSGAQTLFNEQFAGNCGKPCQGMLVWTGYNPPIGSLASLPEVAQYVNDVRAIDPKIDVTNQFLEGAYLGMKVFVEALRRVGPDLSRERLRQVLNTTCFDTDLASRLCWTEKSRHANKRAQAFSIVVAQGSFAGFKNEQTGFIEDPLL